MPPSHLDEFSLSELLWEGKQMQAQHGHNTLCPLETNLKPNSSNSPHMGISVWSHVEVSFYINSEKACTENDHSVALFGSTVLPVMSLGT